MKDEIIITLIDKARKYRSETSNVEFKDARGGIPTNLWRSISSFSHSPGGGIIIFGVKEDRNNNKIHIVGGLDLAFLQEKILSYIREKMQNPGGYELKILEYKQDQRLGIREILLY